MSYNIEWLIQKYSDPAAIPFLFFWGHQPSKDGTITKTCFSQWWVAPFEVEGITYLTAEHWMMAGKARMFGDEAAMPKILGATKPAVAKEEGRKVLNFVPEVWDKVKFDLVVEGNWHKFSQHPALKGFLLQTGEKVLVEASPVDRIWGIGLAADHPSAGNPGQWQGENLLGFALMEVRDKLKG
jgi:ribA/ribD-fused uncharacterized protein